VITGSLITSIVNGHWKQSSSAGSREPTQLANAAVAGG
jgi:hypothetical protein